MNENTMNQQSQPTAAAQQCGEAAEPKHALDTDTKVRLLIEQIGKGDVDEATMGILRHAVNHDEEVKNAETEGYLRGRNEKIDLATRPEAVEEPAAEPATFPRYHRRSVWD